MSASLGAVALTARAIASWASENQRLLDGLSALRALGDQAEEAVDAALRVPAIRRVVLSYLILQELAASSGSCDAEEVQVVTRRSDLERALFGMPRLRAVDAR